jgi:hypothetical protein
LLREAVEKPSCSGLSEASFVAGLSKIRRVMSLPKIPFVVSLSNIPFVVSLSNHALGTEAKSPGSRLRRDDDIGELVESRL